MAEVFLSSDPHFNHARILQFEDKNRKKFRGDLFVDVDDMNEYIIKQHNSVVNPADHWWCLGDVFFGSNEDKVDSILSRMNGKKRLIIGNHDNIKSKVILKHFEKIVLWRPWPEYKIILSHVPVHSSTLGDKYDLNVHGHIHQNDPPKGPYLNVSMEKINYVPVNIDEVRRVYKTQQFNC